MFWFKYIPKEEWREIGRQNLAGAVSGFLPTQGRLHLASEVTDLAHGWGGASKPPAGTHGLCAILCLSLGDPLGSGSPAIRTGRAAAPGLDEAKLHPPSAHGFQGQSHRVVPSEARVVLVSLTPRRRLVCD